MDEKGFLALVKETCGAEGVKAEKILAFFRFENEKFNRDSELTEYVKDMFDSFHYKSNMMQWNGQFFIYTDEEADESMCEGILNSLEFFSTDFLSEHVLAEDKESIAEIKETPYANEEIRQKLEEAGIEDFMEDTLKLYGRGEFLASFDGKEHKEIVNGTEYFIYRID